MPSVTTGSRVKLVPLKGKISVHDRMLYQSAARAMQGNIIMALIELITNSNDSYGRLGLKDRKITITYKKDGFKGVFAVIDEAEGLSFGDFQQRLTTYWNPSDMQEGNTQRGYFGKGAKDALGYMDDGQIASFKDGQFILARIYFDADHNLMYEVEEQKASPALRKKYGIANNGTVASFIADPQSDKKVKVPQFNTLHDELSNHYLMRKILKDDNAKVILVNLKGRQKDKRRLVYVDPKGTLIHEEKFNISLNGYDPFVIDLSVSRSETLLSQKEKGDTRQGGLLIMDEKDVVLDISLFKYDYDPVAATLFGEVVINGFRKMLKNNETVLSPERDGLIQTHPFVESLVKELNARLDRLVQREKERLSRFDLTSVGKEHQKRQVEFCRLLNEIAIDELEHIEIDEPEPSELPYPINGFQLTPESSQVAANAHTLFRLIIDTKKVPSGTAIELKSTNPTIKFENKNDRILVPQKKVAKKRGPSSQMDNVVVAHITVVGSKPAETAKITAHAPDRTAQAKVYITAPEDIGKYGVAFQFDNIIVPPNHPRKVSLFACPKVIKTGDKIELKSDNKHVHISEQTIIVDGEKDLSKGVLKYEVEVWGEGEGQEGFITAYCESASGWECENLMGVEIRYKQTSKKDKVRDSIFSPPEYRTDPEPPQPASYSSEMEKVFIYTRFPTVSYYVGQNCEMMYSLPAQLYVANLVMDRYFYQLAYKSIDRSGTVLSERSKHDAILRKQNELTKKYGTKLLNVLVDQKLLKKSFKDKNGE